MHCVNGMCFDWSVVLHLFYFVFSIVKSLSQSHGFFRQYSLHISDIIDPRSSPQCKLISLFSIHYIHIISKPVIIVILNVNNVDCINLCKYDIVD